MGSKSSFRARLSEAVYTCCCFWVAVSALPALALSYVVVRASKRIWLKILSSRYPHLEFIKADTIRSILDTHRNQGIINVLLCIKGPLEPDQIKQKLLEHVVEKRAKSGEYQYPRMRSSLVSCWGNYAWHNTPSFRLENHFLVSQGVYRARPVTDNNIQDYVSDIVSKYFPTDVPPWQFIVIPCISNELKYYILVRVHHLLLTGEKSINIGDLLLVEQTRETSRINEIQDGRLTSSLVRLFPKPSAIPEFFEKIGEIISNAWNEFVSEYDPVESPKALKSMPGAFHCFGLVVIATTCALREVNKRRCSDYARMRDAASTTALLLSALKYECKRRNLTILKIVASPLVTVDPRKWPRRVLSAVKEVVTVTVTWPFRLRDELNALQTYRESGEVLYSSSVVGRFGYLAQLGRRAATEAARGAWAAYTAPRQLWQDALLAASTPPHALQTHSLCGRKVASWSRAVPRAHIERIAGAHGVSTTDVCLYTAARAVLAYFHETHQPAPALLLASARAHTEDFLFAFSEGDGKTYKKSQTGGMVCLSLPVEGSVRGVRAVVERACRRQGALAGLWAAQTKYGAITRALPSPIATIALNALSRKYALSYTEVDTPCQARARRTLWGHLLDHIVYWRPPQANISMSLTLIQYADTVRLSVMTDARLTPGHTIPAAKWHTIVQDLLSKIDQNLPKSSFQPIEPAKRTTEHSQLAKPVPVSLPRSFSDSVQGIGHLEAFRQSRVSLVQSGHHLRRTQSQNEQIICESSQDEFETSGKYEKEVQREHIRSSSHSTTGDVTSDLKENSQGQSFIPSSASTNANSDETYQKASLLTPPQQRIISPPPNKRKIIHHD